jgi:hypothetical protein
MTPRALVMKRPINLPRWLKRLLSVWNLENIKIVKRVIVSVVGATVLLLGIALLILPARRSSLFRSGLLPNTHGRDAG